MKYIAPLAQRFHHLPRPMLFRGHHPSPVEEMTTGQRIAEHTAALVGSWPFLIGQAVALAAWIVYNILTFTAHFDPMPFILLNLCLSFQAGFTGPILLIAANAGAVRDHAQYDRMEAMEHTLQAEITALHAKLDALSPKPRTRKKPAQEETPS